MKQLHSFIGTSVLTALTGILIGCSFGPAAPAPPERHKAVSPMPLYEQANRYLSDVRDFSWDTHSDIYIQENDTTLHRTISKEITYGNYGGELESVSITQKETFADRTITSRQQYCGGWGYLTLGDNHFKSRISTNDWMKTVPPTPLPDLSLYQTVQGRISGDYLLIGFSQPRETADWPIPKAGEIRTATAMIVLSGDGAPITWKTTLEYTLGSTTVQTQTTATMADTFTSPMDITADTDGYTTVGDWNGLLMLERCSGYLASLDSISSQSVQTIACQASGLEHTQTTNIALSGGAESFEASVTIDAVLTDLFRMGNTTTYRQREQFRDNQYQLEANGEITQDPHITRETMETYCRNTLVSTIPLLHYIEDARKTLSDEEILFRFAGNEALARQICAAACDTLYQDPEYLDSAATEKTVDSVECTLRIQTKTGLPISASIVYRGSHNINGTDYTLTAQFTQNYFFP